MTAGPPDRIAAALAGRYTLRHELGHGGMATVYLAEDVKHGRQVAVKVFRPELASALGADRFVREIQVASALNHPHILPLHDSGAADGSLFYVMPLVRGKSLRDRLAREGPLPIDEAIRLTRQVCSALAHAHAHGLIHRDIKPENVLLHEGEAMLADFGIAVAFGPEMDDRLTGTGLALGTPAYMSPEQASGERALDARSDQYGVACVLFELLAGEPPFTGSAQAVIVKRFTDPVPSVRRLRPTVPAGVERTLLRALARAPGDRFESIAAFADALIAPDADQQRSPSVAVLPFANLSTDPENEFFADGITEDVIAQLSKIRSLKVISRTSVMPFKNRTQSLREIGATLGVTTLLEGSVRRAGNRVRIVAQLIDADSDRHLWAETYDRDLNDIFAIQSDVALQIATALEAELSPEEQRRIRKEPTDNVRAYQLYLLGRHSLVQWTEQSVAQGLKHLGEAIDVDPNYALAYATLAHAYTDIGGLGVASTIRPEEAYRRAKAAVMRALELDDGLAEAHAALGHLKYVCDFDWAGAERELKRAIELNPGSGEAYDAYGRMLSALGRYDEALEMQRRAHELDPLHHRVDVITTLLRAGRHAEALTLAIQLAEVEPHFAMAHSVLGWAYLLSDKPEEGLAELALAVALAPGVTMYLAQHAEALAQVGRADQARQLLQQLEELATRRYVSPYHLAYVHTGLGDHDRAMDALEQAYQERAGGVYGIKGSFLFTPLRDHPRFITLLRKMNLA